MSKYVPGFVVKLWTDFNIKSAALGVVGTLVVLNITK